ncbi:hypothetical protein [Fischerella sp.]|nr:hypothetical protein [Fischerella sp.]
MTVVGQNQRNSFVRHFGNGTTKPGGDRFIADLKPLNAQVETDKS